MKSKETQKTWSGYRVETQTVRAAWAPVVGLADEVVRLLPSFKDTKRGRSRSLQFKGTMIGVGILVVAFAGREWIVFGVFMMLLSLVLPIGQLAKRVTRARLKRWQTRKTETQIPVEIVYDGRRLAVQIEGKIDCRVLLTKDDHKVEEAEHRSQRLVVVRSGSKRKREHIWLLSHETGNGEDYSDDDVHKPVIVDTETLNEIITLVEAL